MGTKDDRIGTDGEKKKEVKIEKASKESESAVAVVQDGKIKQIENRLDEIEDFLVQFGWKK